MLENTLHEINSLISAHNEDCTHNHEPLPVFSETRLLELAKRAQHRELYPLEKMPDTATVAEIEKECGIADIRHRLGSAYPRLDFAQEAMVIMAFHEEYDQLPTSHPRFSHVHDEEHHHHNCGKSHGPIRRIMETLERKTLGKIRSRRIKTLAAMAFRASSLIVCPGDDIVAIGLQTYSAFANQGHVQEQNNDHGHNNHGHQNMFAILPRRPEIQTETPPVPGHQQQVRNRQINLNAAHQTHTAEAKTAHKEHRKWHKALLGCAAVVLAGGLFSSASTPHDAHPQHPVISQPETKPAIVSQPPLIETVVASKGDSQWEVAETHISEATGHTNNALVNAVTALISHTNRNTHPNPHQLLAGQELRIPSHSAIKQMSDALNSNISTPNPRLTAELNALNNQPSHKTQTIIIERIQAALIT